MKKILIFFIKLRFKMVDYSLKVGYALTGRAYCRGCWYKIDKGILRLAYVIDVGDKLF